MKWMLSLALAALLAVPNAHAQDEDRAAELRRAKAEIEKALREVESAMKQLEKLESAKKGGDGVALQWALAAPSGKAKGKVKGKAKAKKKGRQGADYFVFEGAKKDSVKGKSRARLLPGKSDKKGVIRRFITTETESGDSIQLEAILEDVTEGLEGDKFPALIETILKGGDEIIRLRRDGSSTDGPLALLLERAGDEDCDEDCCEDCDECDEDCCEDEEAMMKGLRQLLGNVHEHSAKAKGLHRFLAQAHGGKGEGSCPVLQHGRARSIIRMAPHLNFAAPPTPPHAAPRAPRAQDRGDRGLKREVKELRRRVARLEKMLGDRSKKSVRGQWRVGPPAPKAPARPKAKQRKSKRGKKSRGKAQESKRIILGALPAPGAIGMTRIVETEDGIRLAVEPQIESRDQVILEVKPIAAPAPTKRHRL